MQKAISSQNQTESENLRKKQDKAAEIRMFDGLARQVGYDLCERNVMLDMIDTLNNRHMPLTGTILELGCGTGAAGHLLLQHNKKVRPDSNDRVIGIDISPESVRVANEHRPDSSYTAQVGDLEDAAIQPAGRANAVMCCGVLHHFRDCSKVIQNLSVWAADNARLVILEPNGDNPSDKIGKFFRHMIELVFGTEAIMSRQLATPNETGHAIATYRELVKQNGWTIEFETSFTPEQSCKDHVPRTTIFSLLSACRAGLNRLIRMMFPKSLFSGATYMMVAKKE